MKTTYKVEAKVNGEWVVLAPRMYKKALVKAFCVACKQGGYKTKVTKITK